jgi:hypothetical protein
LAQRLLATSFSYPTASIQRALALALHITGVDPVLPRVCSFLHTRCKAETPGTEKRKQ